MTEETWSVRHAIDHYAVDRWGLGYFTVNEQGNVCVKPSPDSPHKVDLKQVLDELRLRNIHTPILIRVMDILKDRIHKLSDCFNQAIADNKYQAPYYPLFPIKVNQEKDVISSILRFGEDVGVGLEAGSKAELMIIMAMAQFPETPLVCNGYKDPEFVRLVCMAHQIGKKIFPVIENFGEIETFINHYRETGVMPNLGVRIKLATRGVGQWAKTGGDASKFGLRIAEVMRLVERLKEEGLMDSLKLLHFHIGSQVSHINVVKQAINETMRVYTELVKLGAPLEYLDLGGGLGVDYEGAEEESSINYTIEEYTNDIVYRVKQICDEHQIQHPTLFSESGRFLSAHYSLLITDVPATSSIRDAGIEPDKPHQDFGPLKEMYEILGSLKEPGVNVAECYHDAVQYKSEALNMFSLGYLSLEDRANMEILFWSIMLKIRARDEALTPTEAEELRQHLADTYFTNFSLFQSLPDSWAIDQLFPIIPLHRLNERPMRRAVIADLTCDSDGLIESYVGEDEESTSLLLHEVKPDEPYYVGVFLVGAYQETLGELHNLFGDPHAVQVSINGENQYSVRSLIKGDTVRQVMSYVTYDPEKLSRKMRQQVEQALENGHINIDQAARLMRDYEEGMDGYTYFED